MCKRGEIMYAELPDSKGSIQNGRRPVVIIQNNIGNKYSPTVIVAVLTSRGKKDMPTHVNISKSFGLESDSKVLCEQVLTINKTDLKNVICILPESIMKQVDDALLVSIGITPPQPQAQIIDETIINDLCDIIQNRKVNAKTLFTIVVRYCNGFKVDPNKYTAKMKIA